MLFVRPARGHGWPYWVNNAFKHKKKVILLSFKLTFTSNFKTKISMIVN